jgi:predicted PurR-regulated permease PerM
MNNRTITITTKSILMFFGLGIAVAIAWYLHHFLLIVLVAVVIASFVEPLVLALRRIRIPRYVSVPLIFLLGIGIIGGTIALLIPVFSKELSDLLTLFPKGSSFAKGLTSLSKEGLSETTLQRFGGSTNPITALQNIWDMLSNSGIGNLASALFDLTILGVLSFYLAIQEKGVDHFLRAITPKQYEERILATWQRVEKKIGDWFGGQVIAAIIVGMITYGGLMLFQVPYALILAITAAVFDLLPFGTILGSIPAALIGFSVGGFSMAFWVMVLYGIIHYLEIYFIQPLIIRRTVGIPIVIMIISVVAWTTLAGILGLLLSIPFAILMTDILGERV